MRRRRSLLQRIGDVLRGAVGGGGGRRRPPPISQTPPPPPEGEEPQSIPPRPPPIEETPLRGNVEYEHERYTIVGSHSKHGKSFNYTQKVLGRWTVGNEYNPASISDVSDLLRQVPKSGWVTLIIGGASPVPYPGQEDQSTTWKGYSYQLENLEDFADDPNNTNATNWMNALLVGTGEFWDEVYYVQIVDR
jgi:hypothetical protein